MKLYNPLLIAAIVFLQSGCRGQKSLDPQFHIDPEAESLFIKDYENSRQWSSFRGHFARGYLDNAELPENWDLETMENVRWKIPIPGLGLSCPVVWDETVFITTAVGEEGNAGIKTGIYGEGEPVDDESVHRWMVYAIDKQSGETRWSRVACTGVPEVRRHPKSSHANPTVATDGRHVVAFFGSEGIYCYDFEGNLKWERDFGLLMSSAYEADWAEWEFASSPLLYRDRVIIQADVKENSFLAALHVETGEVIWKKSRSDWPGWSTPNLYYHEGKARIAVNGYQHRGGYDFETGEEVWRMAGGGDVPVPTPVLSGNLLFFNSAHGRQNPILAVHTGAEGRIRYPEGGMQDDAVVWYRERGGAYLQTMLVYRGLLYSLRWNGNLECMSPETGEQYYRETVAPQSFVSSPVAADGKIYVISEEGVVYILEAGPEFRIIGSVELGEITLSTPAITDGMIIFRTVSHLIGVGGQE